MVKGMRVQDIFKDDFPIKKGIDFMLLEDSESSLQDYPRMALKNCGILTACLMTGQSMIPYLERGANTDGVTEDGVPFFSPLLWAAMIRVQEWEREKEGMELLMLYKADVNFIGLCGFSLLHYYLVQALLYDRVYKLRWWLGFPMVNLHLPILLMSGKKDKKVTLLSPLALLQRLAEKYPERISSQRMIQVTTLLFSKGASVHSCPSGWMTDISQIKADRILREERKDALYDRLCAQWGVGDEPVLLRFLIQNRTHLCCHLIRNCRVRYYESRKLMVIPTPQMNDVEDLPLSHLFSFYPKPSGLGFIFHASYMESIFKTHIFPYTGESIALSQIRRWLTKMSSSSHMLPREEFVLEEVIQSYPEFLCQDPMDYGGITHDLLQEWVRYVFPYSRLYLLRSFPFPKESMYHYLCQEMVKGFPFSCFPRKKTHPHQSWQDIFFWSSHDAILQESFLYANYLEELISRLELFRQVQQKLAPRVFHKSFTGGIQNFLESDEYFFTLSRFLTPFLQEYEMTIYRVFSILKSLSMLFTVNDEDEDEDMMVPPAASDHTQT